MEPKLGKYGARVYFQGKNTVLIKQTEKSGGRYVLSDPIHKERHLKLDNAAGMARALQLAKEGRLTERDQ